MTADPSAPQTKTCARCGAGFGCGALGGACWCADVILPEAAAQALRAAYDDCLCPACLSALAQAPDRPAPRTTR